MIRSRSSCSCRSTSCFRVGPRPRSRRGDDQLLSDRAQYDRWLWLCRQDVRGRRRRWGLRTTKLCYASTPAALPIISAACASASPSRCSPSLAARRLRRLLGSVTASGILPKAWRSARMLPTCSCRFIAMILRRARPCRSAGGRRLLTASTAMALRARYDDDGRACHGDRTSVRLGDCCRAWVVDSMFLVARPCAVFMSLRRRRDPRGAGGLRSRSGSCRRLRAFGVIGWWSGVRSGCSRSAQELHADHPAALRHAASQSILLLFTSISASVAQDRVRRQSMALSTTVVIVVGVQTSSRSC